MQRDKVLGLSLAILLIGFAGAFCFRNETGSIFNGPHLQNARALDDAIASKEGPKPYTGDLDGAKKKPEATPTGVTLEGIEPDTPFASSTPDEPAMTPFTNESAQRRDSWGTPDYMKRTGAGNVRPSTRQPSTSTPISAQKGMTNRQNDVWMPKQNQGWEVEPSMGGTSESDDYSQPNSGMQTHQVRPGDTLTGIASRYLGSSQRYMEIYEANRDVLRTPNDLRAGMSLRIPSQSRSARNPNSTIGPEAHYIDPRGTKPRQKPVNGLPSNGRIQSTPASYGYPRAKTQTEALQGLPSKKFVPVNRSPFSPQSLHGDPNPSKPRPLSQVPPGDLPEMSMQNYPKSEVERNDGETSRELQIIPMTVTPAEKAAAGRRYVVKRGETLESISLKAYGTRSQSLRIFEANRDRLRSPDGLREGISLLLP